ncbi:MAG TPA: tetratricopeptide repeat protein [Roseateles sp.]
MPALSASTRQNGQNVLPLPNAALPEEPLLLLARARNAAFAEAARGNLGQGLGILEDALQDEPMSHDLLSDMAALLLVAGRHEQAGACAERALQICPEHGPSLYTLGFSLSARGQTERAIEVLTLLQSGPACDNLRAEAPDLMPVAMTELQRLLSR